MTGLHIYWTNMDVSTEDRKSTADFSGFSAYVPRKKRHLAIMKTKLSQYIMNWIKVHFSWKGKARTVGHSEIWTDKILLFRWRNALKTIGNRMFFVKTRKYDWFSCSSKSGRLNLKMLKFSEFLKTIRPEKPNSKPKIWNNKQKNWTIYYFHLSNFDI
jgi:hypothetical protein